ncbi:hypothetical protein L210DRAFT_3530868 [Boletus edulis BED1]|uniref:Uncharacterized protein n=1 Tax=Boletus edulis BED1 TaxID=1328754 RepID=A0AAD4GHU5_BOLED|nr:hypothetical protein L210DRAFT_3530868 [Boletus edulis BED1]
MRAFQSNLGLEPRAMYWQNIGGCRPQLVRQEIDRMRDTRNEFRTCEMESANHLDYCLRGTAHHVDKSDELLHGVMHEMLSIDEPSTHAEQTKTNQFRRPSTFFSEPHAAEQPALVRRHSRNLPTHIDRPFLRPYVRP